MGIIEESLGCQRDEAMIGTTGKKVCDLVGYFFATRQIGKNVDVMRFRGDR